MPCLISDCWCFGLRYGESAGIPNGVQFFLLLSSNGGGCYGQGVRGEGVEIRWKYVCQWCSKRNAAALPHLLNELLLVFRSQVGRGGGNRV